ncbi:hypothetical protein [Nocardioides cynanchi]|uniref:hypothetical protein n=1 Tax=Nocardioides cynanchi TaxID=2558918 RepID=UPI001248FBE1|nr:hypothetical protein [Nocardioides cynanchi]
MARRHVAFFRNLNHGQRGSPTRDQLLEAFAAAHATEVTPFQSNGTVIFRAAEPTRVVDLARASLGVSAGWSDIAPVRRASWVRDLVDHVGEVADNAEISFYDDHRDFPEPLPWRPEGGRVTVVQADRLHAVSTNDEPRTSYATPTLEALLGIGVTSRGLATMQKLAERLR